MGFPLLSMVAYKFYTGTWGKEMYEKGLEKVCIFWAEHVKEPCEYLYVEVSERSERAFWKTSILAMKCAK